MNIIVKASFKTIEHKMEHQFAHPEDHTCYWTFAATPKQTNLKKILFTNGKNVFAEGDVIAVEDKCVVFKPLKKVDYKQPRSPPPRGFAYVI